MKSLAHRHDRPNEFRQLLDHLAVVGDFIRMRKHIVGQQQHVLRELRQQAGGPKLAPKETAQTCAPAFWSILDRRAQVGDAKVEPI